MCRICLSFFAGYYFFYSLPPVCLLSVANLALFRAELVIFKSVTYMLFLLCSALAACSFFWSSEPQEEGRNPLILSEAPLLMLAALGQEEGHTSPYALHGITTSTSFCNLSTAPRTRGEGLTQPHCQVTESKKAAFSSIPIKSLLYFFKLEGRRKATHGVVSSERENPFYYIKFRRWAKEGDMAPSLQQSHWQWCSAGKYTFKTSFKFFFQRLSKCMYTQCVYAQIHTHG